MAFSTCKNWCVAGLIGFGLSVPAQSQYVPDLTEALAFMEKIGECGKRFEKEVVTLVNRTEPYPKGVELIAIEMRRSSKTNNQCRIVATFTDQSGKELTLERTWIP